MDRIIDLQSVDRLRRITRYKLPEWEDLPDGIRSSEFQQYIQDELGWLFPHEDLLTGYMLQNYLKWGVLPYLDGRKYSREHVAWVMTITVLKRVLVLDQVKQGIILQKKLMTEQASYEVLRNALSKSLRSVFNPVFSAEPMVLETIWVGGGDLGFSGLKIEGKQFSVSAACHALAWQLLTTCLLDFGGWVNLNRAINRDII